MEKRPIVPETAIAGQASDALAAIVDALHGIARKLDALLNSIAAANVRAGQRALARRDQHALEVLVPAIRTSCGDSNFTTGELLEHAVGDTHLRQAIETALGSCDPICARRLGRLFARATEINIHGLAIQRLGSVRAGALWRVTLSPRLS